ADRADRAAVGERRACHAADRRAGDRAFLLVRHAGAAGEPRDGERRHDRSVNAFHLSLLEGMRCILQHDAATRRRPIGEVLKSCASPACSMSEASDARMARRGGKSMSRRLMRAFAALAAVVACAASAQSYPTRPVKIIVPFAAGGPADIYARVLADKLQAALGQPFVVEDRPGGGSLLGTEAVHASPPDGYTLLMMSNTHTVNESLIKDKPFELMRDFVPVAPVNYSDLVMVIHPSVHANNLK